MALQPVAAPPVRRRVVPHPHLVRLADASSPLVAFPRASLTEASALCPTRATLTGTTPLAPLTGGKMACPAQMDPKASTGWSSMCTPRTCRSASRASAQRALPFASSARTAVWNASRFRCRALERRLWTTSLNAYVGTVAPPPSAAAGWRGAWRPLFIPPVPAVPLFSPPAIELLHFRQQHGRNSPRTDRRPVRRALLRQPAMPLLRLRPPHLKVGWGTSVPSVPRRPARTPSPLFLPFALSNAPTHTHTHPPTTPPHTHTHLLRLSDASCRR